MHLAERVPDLSELDESGYLSPRLQVRDMPSKGGNGLFAGSFIPAGELLIYWNGRRVTRSDIDALSLDTPKLLQMDDDEFDFTVLEVLPQDNLNHSCEPNCGFTSNNGVVSIRDIQPGEEVVIDYAMCESTAMDEFECECGTRECRTQVTGTDWQSEVLQERYNGFFMPYLQRRIDAITGPPR